MSSSVVVASADSVIQCRSCKFVTDLGNCTGTSGACIVENASKSVFHHCTFETTIPGMFLLNTYDVIGLGLTRMLCQQGIS